jgi:hypothetical protein
MLYLKADNSHQSLAELARLALCAVLIAAPCVAKSVDAIGTECQTGNVKACKELRKTVITAKNAKDRLAALSFISDTSFLSQTANDDKQLPEVRQAAASQLSALGRQRADRLAEQQRQAVLAEKQALEHSIRVQMSLTTADQPAQGRISVSIGDFTRPSAELKPEQGTSLPLPEHNIFLLVQLAISPLPGRTARPGADIYLQDGKGLKQVGYAWALSGWVGADALSLSLDKGSSVKFLYTIDKDAIPSAVFHFLGVDFKVPTGLDVNAR